MDKREQAKKMYEKGKPYKEISSSLDVPLNTLKSWKKRNSWQRGGAPKEVQPSSRGAPQGNKNAEGNKGGSAPQKNKNALKTGEFETIYFDLLSDDEKAIYSADFSLVDRLNQDIQELTMRKYRMMKRINEAEKGLNLVETEKLYELRGRKQYVDSEKGGKKISIEVPQVTMTEMKEKSIRKIEDILRIEDALTRISNQLIRTIKQLEEISLNEKRLQVFEAQRDKLKAETEELRGSNKGNEDANNWSELVAEAEKELGDHNE